MLVRGDQSLMFKLKEIIHERDENSAASHLISR